MDTKTTDTGSKSSGFNDQFIQSLQDRLLASSGVVSSDGDKISSAIASSIDASNKATEASKLSIKGSFGREIAAAETQGLNEITTFREGQRGYATQTAALSTMLGQSDKRINDLKQREQELLSSADAKGAQDVSALMLKEYEMQQENTQKVFSNLISLGGFAVNVASEDRQKKAQDMTERNTISAIALKYGLPVSEEDTIDTITAKAMPFASQEQKLQLAKAAADVRLANAQADKALADGKAVSDPTVIDAMAKKYLTSPQEIGSMVKDTATYGKIVKRASELQNDTTKGLIQEEFSNGTSKTEVINDIKNNPNIIDKAAAISNVESIYGSAEKNPTAPKSSDNLTLKDLSTAIAGGLYNMSAFLSDFALGSQTPRVKDGVLVDPKTGKPITFGDLKKYKQ